MTRDIERVVADNLCVGCGACAGIFANPAAEMVLSPEGFLRPVQLRQLNAHERKLFQEVCPGRGLQHVSRDESFTPLWGPIQSVETGFASDPEVRFRGSSGGALSALAIHLLESGKVQGVLHIAPSTSSPFDNVARLSTNREHVLEAAGSRYAPVAPLANIHSILSMDGVFAFVGKPCDVAAMRALQRVAPEYKSKFPYLLSFMCAGTPSLEGTKAVVRKMGFDPNHVIRFRYRGNGWPGSARADTVDGRVGEMDYDASWGQVLNRYLQFRCKICPDGTGEFADVTCADAWYGDEKGYPTFVESDGRSLVLGRTAKGLLLIQQACQAGTLLTQPLQLRQIEGIQPYQANRKRALIARLVGLRLALKATPLFDRMGLQDAAKSMPIGIHIRNAAGTFLRACGLKSQ